MITYRLRRKGETAWRTITAPPLPRVAADVPAEDSSDDSFGSAQDRRRPPLQIDQMTNAELKAELRRRLPCCRER